MVQVTAKPRDAIPVGLFALQGQFAKLINPASDQEEIPPSFKPCPPTNKEQAETLTADLRKFASEMIEQMKQEGKSIPSNLDKRLEEVEKIPNALLGFHLQILYCLNEGKELTFENIVGVPDVSSYFECAKLKSCLEQKGALKQLDETEKPVPYWIFKLITDGKPDKK